MTSTPPTPSLDSPTERLLTQVLAKLRKQLAPLIAGGAYGSAVVTVNVQDGRAVIAEASTSEKCRP